MAFCKQCGAELTEGATFCSKCGAKVEGSVPNEGIISANNASIEKKGGSKAIVGAVAVVVLILAAVIGIKIKNASKTAIDIESMVEMNLNGFDGYATADPAIDTNEVYDFIELNYSDLPKEDISKFIDKMKVKASADKDLKNGQEIEMTLSYDTAYAKEHKIKFTKDEWTYKIADNEFEPVKELDPFEEDTIKIEYTGVAPFVQYSIQYNNNSDVRSYLRYESTPDPYSGYIKAGDIITVTCESDADMLLKKGYVLKETKREYPVDSSEMDEYVTDPSMLGEECLTRMKKEAEDIINAKLLEANQDRQYVEYGDLNYIGSAALTLKDYPGNSVYLVYSVDCTSSPDSADKGLVKPVDFDPVTMYIPVEFKEVIKYKAGNKVDYQSVEKYLKRSDIVYNTWYGALYGYKDSSSMFTEIIRQKTDRYNYVLDSELEKIF